MNILQRLSLSHLQALHDIITGCWRPSAPSDDMPKGRTQFSLRLLCTAPSQFRLHVLHIGIAGRWRCHGNILRWGICYLVIWQGSFVLWMYLYFLMSCIVHIISLSGIGIPDEVLSLCALCLSIRLSVCLSVLPSLSYFDFSSQIAVPIWLKFGSNIPLLNGNGDCTLVLVMWL